MKIVVIVALSALLGLAGCHSTGANMVEPTTIENVSVTVGNGRVLKEAVISAAVNRRWMPSEQDASTIRCTLIQRAHRVVVDVKLLDASHYSIFVVESNIPARKVAQWLNNLQRDIAKYALR